MNDSSRIYYSNDTEKKVFQNRPVLMFLLVAIVLSIGTAVYFVIRPIIR